MKPSFKFECGSIFAIVLGLTGLAVGASDMLMPTMLVIGFVCVATASILREMGR